MEPGEQLPQYERMSKRERNEALHGFLLGVPSGALYRDFDRGDRFKAAEVIGERRAALEQAHTIRDFRRLLSYSFMSPSGREFAASEFELLSINGVHEDVANYSPELERRISLLQAADGEGVFLWANTVAIEIDLVNFAVEESNKASEAANRLAQTQKLQEARTAQEIDDVLREASKVLMSDEERGYFEQMEANEGYFYGLIKKARNMDGFLPTWLQDMTRRYGDMIAITTP